MKMQEFLNNECDYIRVDKCEQSNEVLMVFSHVGYPPGKFAMSNELENIPVTKLYVNCHENSWYQQGLKGVAPSIHETTELLAGILNQLEPSKVTCVGMSMGAYAAILFGIKLQCDAVIAFTPELLIGQKHSRSFYLNDLKKYDYQYIQLSHLIRENIYTKIYAIYGVYDTIDLSFLWLIGDVFVKDELFKAFFLRGGHQVTRKLDVNNIVKTLIQNGILHDDDIHKEYCLDQHYGIDELLLFREIQRLLLKKDSQSIYDLLKNHPSAKHIIQLDLQLGTACIDLKKYSEAENILLHIAKIDPNSHLSRHLLGILYFSLKELDKSKLWYEKALKIEPNAPTTIFRLGSVEYELQNKELAENYFKRALKLNPKHSKAHFQYGILLMNDNRFGEAEIHFKNALIHEPQNDKYKKHLKMVEVELSKENLEKEAPKKNNIKKLHQKCKKWIQIKIKK